MTASLVAFLLAASLIVVLPGPDTLVVLRGLVRGGRREGVLTSLGVMTGLLVWVPAAVYCAVLVAAAGTVGAWMRTPRIRRRLDGTAGVFLIGFGVRIATEG
ncbi:MAG: hypothetical protein QM774_10075 [Gordonia sp. (in: high G+C Gram-positive bacteria)]|uniref:hypothetical protein n=1 Tax=Gordonia sp. (in: high G+C Gram-positive bacteria) TaxID=84139 RepID=UPI0039E33757